MQIITKEHHDLMREFERIYNDLRIEKEDKSMWPSGQIYQNGETNNLFKAFRMGYSLGKHNYQQ